MKPVCDHPSYCKTDSKAIYIGQTHHIATLDTAIDKYVPSGLDKVASKWDGLCSYTASANGNHALCNVPANTHSWQHATQDRKFMCGKIDGAPFTASLGSKNGVPARTIRVPAREGLGLLGPLQRRHDQGLQGRSA